MNRRRQERIPVSGNGTMCWSDGPQVVSISIAIGDVSEDGVQIRSPRVVRAGDMVRVAGDTCEFVGVARHCRRDGEAWVAGIQLASPAYSRESADYVG